MDPNECNEEMSELLEALESSSFILHGSSAVVVVIMVNIAAGGVRSIMVILKNKVWIYNRGFVIPFRFVSPCYY